MTEEDSFKRAVTVGNVIKEISEICPFQENDEFLLNDIKLPRYLFLSLPLMQKVVDTLINSLLYKFQGNLYFLYNFYNDCVLIFKQKEYRDEEIYEAVVKKIEKRLPTDPDELETISGEEQFGDFVKNSSCIEVRLNILKIKQATYMYYMKLIKIFETVISLY